MNGAWFRRTLCCRAALIALGVFFSCAALAEDKPQTPGPNAEVQRAMLAVQGAAPVAAPDPRRPQFHFLPPAQWMNDPNGPIFHNGYYHLFYQHNPYGDRWEHMHWGHARSKDLVKWEHLPIALWPSEEQGERHCFSGSATVAPNGELMLFYTSIGHPLPEQWAAVPAENDLLVWRKHPKNPLLTEQLHGAQKVWEWRDPYLFEHGGRRYAVIGGNLNESKGGQASVQLYRAEDEGLTQWTYLGPLFVHPDQETVNIECPNFFPLGDRWVLIVSAHRAPEYFVGTFDPEKPEFVVEQRGVVDHGDYYAPNGCFDPQGRHLLWGWIRGFDFAKGWNGCLSLPRVLSLDANKQLRQRPAPELESLRLKEMLPVQPVALRPDPVALPRVSGASLELQVELAAATSVRVALHTEDDVPVVIRTEGEAVFVNDTALPGLSGASQQGIRLQLFIDHSVVELYVNDGEQCFSRPFAALGEPVAVSLAGEGSASAQAWALGTIW